MNILMCRPIKYRWILEWEQKDPTSKTLPRSLLLPSTIAVVMMLTSVPLTSLMSSKSIFLSSRHLHREIPQALQIPQGQTVMALCVYMCSDIPVIVYFQPSISSPFPLLFYILLPDPAQALPLLRVLRDLPRQNSLLFTPYSLCM